jgi:hypothetical protein
VTRPEARFEKLEVWKKAVYSALGFIRKGPSLKIKPDLTARSGLSTIHPNVAEDSEGNQEKK